MTLPEAVSNRLIGALFVERGLVSRSQLVVALELQQETGQQLGQILVERFGVERSELAKVVAEHWARMGEAKEDVSTRANESWQQLGEILVSRGFVTREQLVQALERQRLTGERLGEALVGQGVISKFELAGSLAEQASLVEAPEGNVEGETADVVELAPRLEAALAAEPGPGLVPPSVLTPEPAYGTPESPKAPEPEDVAQPEGAEPESVTEPQRPREPRPAVELILESVAGRTADIEPEPEPAEGAGLASLYEVPVEAEREQEPVYVEHVEHVEAAEPESELEPVAHHDEAPEPEPATAACVAFASTPRGYRLVELEDGVLPEVGEHIDVPDVGELVVLRHGRSPLPADERVCVFLEQLVPAGVPA